MPTVIEKYKVFLASPGDLVNDRQSIEDVISELNTTYGNKNNLIIELVKWETHSAPGASSSDVQSLIDDDIKLDYDLFIGILWARFGTPTNKFESGTEQEFYNAYEIHKKTPNSIQILFYFNISGPSLITSIDTNQLQKVNAFKKGLGEKSVLYWEYSNSNELQRFLRIHIPKRIDDLRKPKDNSINEEFEKIKTPITSEVDTEELGIIDYQDLYTEYFEASNIALTNMATATTWIANEINKKTKEITILKKSKENLGTKELRNFYQQLGAVMNSYASRIEPEIPIFYQNFEKGVDTVSNLNNLHRNHLPSISAETLELITTPTISLKTNIDSASEGMAEFLNAIETFPRLEKELNKARVNVENKLKEIINKLSICKSIIQELEKNISSH